MSVGSERVLILAPFGRDGALLERVLNKGKIEAAVCSGFDSLCNAIVDGAGALLIADEALCPKRVEFLAELLKEQPSWSDLSLLVMTTGGEATLASGRRLDLLAPIQGPMTLLERPLRAATLLSTVRATLRSRRRQYLVRDLLEKERQSATALQVANSALRRSNESLAEFAHVASHDLKEPLRSVAAYSQLLGRRYKGKLDKEAEEYIDLVLAGTVRMNRLIEDLLDYSKVTRDFNPSGIRTDCNAVVQTVKENLHALIEKTGATILASELPVVAVEFRQMVQLFQNLIGNALKYGKREAPPDISIGAVAEESLCLFHVADNGIGFDQEYAEQIFGVFKRLHRNDETGTGIGLAICKRIVEHYGGRIWATSSAGRGATFFFLLPGINT